MIVTSLIGIASAMVGGYISTFFGYGDVSGFDLRSLGIAIGGALVLRFGYRTLKGAKWQPSVDFSLLQEPPSLVHSRHLIRKATFTAAIPDRFNRKSAFLLQSFPTFCIGNPSVLHFRWIPAYNLRG